MGQWAIFHSCQQLKRPILALEKGQGTSHRPQASAGCGAQLIRSGRSLVASLGAPDFSSGDAARRRSSSRRPDQQAAIPLPPPFLSSARVRAADRQAAVGGGQQAASRAQPCRASRWKGEEMKIER